ncbi:hypothetical protein QBC46DRAFT_35392 [Diplogelasinospora grovesii]|uniref:Uncharacterized protein n=1 Tax=Diplogelasinospora grovesii TaxID=303347 RepID=A0AAN6S742_9PEZI|nr:hypothetical protein QBC46DRAFT_35392 [Diplogelasinospora grovesii]
MGILLALCRGAALQPGCFFRNLLGLHGQYFWGWLVGYGKDIVWFLCCGNLKSLGMSGSDGGLWGSWFMFSFGFFFLFLSLYQQLVFFYMRLIAIPSSPPYSLGNPIFLFIRFLFCISRRQDLGLVWVGVFCLERDDIHSLSLRRYVFLGWLGFGAKAYKGNWKRSVGACCCGLGVCFAAWDVFTIVQFRACCRVDTRKNDRPCCMYAKIYAKEKAC